MQLLTTKTSSFPNSQNPLASSGADGAWIAWGTTNLKATAGSGVNAVSGSFAAMVWNTSDYTFLADGQTSSATIGAKGNFDDVGASVLCTGSGATANGYYASTGFSGNSIFINRVDSGTATQLTSGSHTWALNDVLKLSYTLSTHTLAAAVNGSTIISTTDSTYTSGQPGLWYTDGNVNASFISVFTGTDPFVAATSSGPLPRQIYVMP